MSGVFSIVRPKSGLPGKPWFFRKGKGQDVAAIVTGATLGMVAVKMYVNYVEPALERGIEKVKVMTKTQEEPAKVVGSKD